MKKPLISIIVPTFNYSHLIAETLDNLKQQTFQDWECIIIDDGSTDNTADIVAIFTGSDKRYKYFYQENQGLSAARNKGIKQASAPVIQLLDAGDLLAKDKLSSQYNFLNSNESVDIVYGDVLYFFTNQKDTFYKTATAEQIEWMPRVSGSGPLIIAALLKGNVMAVNCPLIKKHVFDKVGEFRKDLPYLEDWDFWLRCATNNISFAYFDKANTAALVRLHNSSISNSKWNMKAYELKIKKDILPAIKANGLHKHYYMATVKVYLQLLKIILKDLRLGKTKLCVKRFAYLLTHITGLSHTKQTIYDKCLN